MKVLVYFIRTYLQVKIMYLLKYICYGACVEMVLANDMRHSAGTAQRQYQILSVHIILFMTEKILMKPYQTNKICGTMFQKAKVSLELQILITILDGRVLLRECGPDELYVFIHIVAFERSG